MLTQIVLLQWRESATSEQRTKATDALATLADVIPEIRSLRVVTDAGLRSENYDVAVVTSFDDEAAWERYQGHPEHVRVVQGSVAPILAAKAGLQLTGAPTTLVGD